MTQRVYVDILDDYLLPYTNDNLAQDWIFQADDDAERTHNVNAKQWSALSSGLSPLEGLWNDVKNSEEKTHQI